MSGGQPLKAATAVRKLLAELRAAKVLGARDEVIGVMAVAIAKELDDASGSAAVQLAKELRALLEDLPEEGAGEPGDDDGQPAGVAEPAEDDPDGWLAEGLPASIRDAAQP